MKRLGLAILAAIFIACSGFTQTVQISDTLYNANGTLASGRIVVSWTAFTAADTTAIAGGTVQYIIPTTGVINLSLYANVGATPTGTSYQARYILSSGTQYTETWVIPASGPVTLADIRVNTVPTPTILFNPFTQLYSSTTVQGDLLVGSSTLGYFLRLPLGANGLCLTSNGTTAVWGSCATGSGITSLNGLLGTAQTFAAGTAGTDFGISSVGTVHTFNLPSSSGTNRGALTSADWTTFNNKQPVLSSSGAVANQFVTGFTAPNTFTRAQPSCADLSDADTGCSSPAGGSSLNFSHEEGPAGAVNGVNVTFTLNFAPSPAQSLKLVYNGLTLRSGVGNDFTVSGTTITMNYAPTAGSNFVAWYQH